MHYKHLVYARHRPKHSKVNCYLLIHFGRVLISYRIIYTLGHVSQKSEPVTTPKLQT